MKYPAGLPVFANRLLKDKSHPFHSLLPSLIVGVDVIPFGVYEIEGLRPDNQDRVCYRARELRPLTRAARDMLAICRGGK